MVTVAAALVIRIAAPPPAAAPASAGFDPAALTAGRLALPEGETVTALGAAGETLLIVTRDGAGVERLRLHAAADGAALRVIPIARIAP